MVLLDTHLVLWAALEPGRLSAKAARLFRSRDTELAFSVATLWEVAIKSSLGRPDFQVDAAALRAGLLGQGLVELPVAAEHALRVASLPWVHRDPFDRLLVAQALVDRHTLATQDAVLAGYGRVVRVL
jgi:PIN domain nuclease of toxin-antitoxin system